MIPKCLLFRSLNNITWEKISRRKTEGLIPRLAMNLSTTTWKIYLWLPDWKRSNYSFLLHSGTLCSTEVLWIIKGTKEKKIVNLFLTANNLEHTLFGLYPSTSSSRVTTSRDSVPKLITPSQLCFRIKRKKMATKEEELQKKREEAERKARRGEIDPTHEFTFQVRLSIHVYIV